MSLLGFYADPAHVIGYTDGEIRQEYEVILIAEPVGGQLSASRFSWRSACSTGTPGSGDLIRDLGLETPSGST